jgi:glycosyltransferase involved in cell wall biosynthesis
VAPLPPPVHGFSNICAAMLELLRGRAIVSVFDRGPRIDKSLFARVRQLVNPVRYLIWCMRNRNAILYVGLSGGPGQFIDWPYVIIGRIFRQCTFIHHHSFAYINAPSILNRWLFFFLRDEIHIVLSQRMGAELTRIYRLNSSKVKVISNAAFYTPATECARLSVSADVSIRLGYLSAVSVEKGMVEFFGVLKELTRLGVAYRARIAGPIDPGVKRAFGELLASSSNVEYCGPIYAEEKDEFYQNLDVFLFPSDYTNEAEPLVVLEAMRSGAYVIACERGAIAEMLANGGGVVSGKAAYIWTAVNYIRNFSVDRAGLLEARGLSRKQARRMGEGASRELASLLDEIADFKAKDAPVRSSQQICGQHRK